MEIKNKINETEYQICDTPLFFVHFFFNKLSNSTRPGGGPTANEIDGENMAVAAFGKSLTVIYGFIGHSYRRPQVPDLFRGLV